MPVGVRDKSLDAFLSARPIADPAKNGHGPDESNAKGDGMSDLRSFIDSLSCDPYRLVRISLEPECPGQGDSCTVAVMKTEVDLVDTLRGRGLDQSGLKIHAGVGLVSNEMMRKADK